MIDSDRLPIPSESDARIDAAIGNTPMVHLTRVVEPGMAEIWVKIEGMNPGGSIKDRTALGMIVDAERRGALRPGQMIVEPTSGNTGIGLAQVAEGFAAAERLSDLIRDVTTPARVGTESVAVQAGS